MELHSDLFSTSLDIYEDSKSSIWVTLILRPSDIRAMALEDGGGGRGGAKGVIKTNKVVESENDKSDKPANWQKFD